MVNGVYTFAKEELINGNIDMDTDTIRIALMDSNETFAAADTSMTSAAANRLDTDIALAGRTITDGVFFATDPTWVAVAGGDTVHCRFGYCF